MVRPVLDPRSKITIDQMAWVFEQLDLDVPFKELAHELGVNVVTLRRRYYRAQELGFQSFAHPSTVNANRRRLILLLGGSCYTLSRLTNK